MKLLAPLFFSLFVVPFSIAEEQPADPSELDFWIGNWQVSWEDEAGETHRGTNTISRILNGKVIKEEFDASEALKFTGSSFSVLDSLTGKWKQTWVDSNGTYMDFEGHALDDSFVFERAYTNAKGEAVENRMVFHSIEADSLIWDWEGRKATDTEWKLLWRLHYERLPIE